MDFYYLNDNFKNIADKFSLDGFKEIRDAKHTVIYRGTYEGNTLFFKILRNYNKKVKTQDVVLAKKWLEKLDFECFEILAAGTLNGEKFYITSEVSGIDIQTSFEERGFDVTIDFYKQSAEIFMKMLKNNLFYFGFNMKNFFIHDNRLILIDIEEIQKENLFFRKKALIKTVWNSLRSLEKGAEIAGVDYKVLETILYEKYSEVFQNSLNLKSEIEKFQKRREILKLLKGKNKR